VVERQGEQAGGAAAHTRVVVVDDHHAVRTGIGAVLLAASDIELVGEAADGQEALRVCEEVRPDVVIMDLKLPKMDGITAIRELRRRDPQVQVLALTSFPDEYWVQEALNAGATSYLLKNVELDALVAAVRATHRHRTTLSPESTQALIRAATRTLSGRSPTVEEGLTAREKEVLALVVEGLGNQQIAERLTITLATVKYHIQHLYGKLGVRTRTGLVAQALRLHLIDYGEAETHRPPYANM
jgi:two-component system, NarL family, response regulator LiaR